jgi:hypothetical protein
LRRITIKKKIKIKKGSSDKEDHMNSNKPTILIVEDDDLQFEIYEEALTAYQLIRVRRGTDALTFIPRTPPEMLNLDHIHEAGERGQDN